MQQSCLRGILADRISEFPPKYQNKYITPTFVVGFCCVCVCVCVCVCGLDIMIVRFRSTMLAGTRSTCTCTSETLHHTSPSDNLPCSVAEEVLAFHTVVEILARSSPVLVVESAFPHGRIP
ncbi:hypothetical protein BO99DRAFT_91752 [Aspergillus violaceofuscus CBS 115571]|uniref:Uncharacterized protein n=1 Tax=Aspergillus violaceofuscus (strain CBS 115571) TaxID=1450538 RepID=A0A2V5HIT5_ASPV1|nr:hypothetical protein BO99DRAFT_91752 [Aspergillus violaceofuscus CBS 115571]